MVDMGVYFQDLTLTIPFAVLFLFSLLPITIKVFRGNTEQKAPITFVQALIGVILVGVIISVRKVPEAALAFENTLIFSRFVKFTSILLVLSCFFTLILSFRHPAVPKNQYSEHVFLLLNALLGMLVLNYSNDLVLVFVGIELLSLPLYVLIGIGGNSLIPKESSFKYFVLGSFASAFLLFGTAFIYGATQSTDISVITNMKEGFNESLLTIGTMIFLIGLFFKIALVPFHAWLADVYQGAPTPITAFMATSVKLVIFSFLLRFMPITNLIPSHALLVTLQWVCILTMFFGNMLALKQTSLKRMLAYSSIAHSGYLFMGLIGGLVGDYYLSAQAILFYLVVYLFTTIGSFAIICVHEKTENQDLNLDSLKGLSQTHPWMALSLTILLLSLAGIPPLGGFFAKLYLFSSVVEAGQIWLAVWAVMSSAIGVYFYLKPVVYMYMKDKETSEEFSGNEGVSNLSMVALSVIIVVALAFLSQPLLTKILKTFT